MLIGQTTKTAAHTCNGFHYRSYVRYIGRGDPFTVDSYTQKIQTENNKKKNRLHKSLLQLLRGRGTGRAESFSENKSKI